MSNTILITGASSGIGLATAKYFEEKGWNVIATMRKPDAVSDLKTSVNLIKCALDVTDNKSIQKAIAKGIKKFGSIDVLVNNAGYGAYGPMEEVPMEDVEKQFAVNVFGVIAVSKALLPHFRKQKSGTIINVSSMGGRMALPFGSLYHSTKYAIEGLTEALRYELKPLGIRLKLIEPGVVRTDFYTRSMDMTLPKIADYKKTMKNMKKMIQTAPRIALSKTPHDVAKAIYKAADSSSSRIRYLVGIDAHFLVWARKLLGTRLFQKMVRIQMAKTLP